MRDEKTELDTSEIERERAGSRALSPFARVLTARVLRAHADGPLTSSKLEARLGWAATASLRLATNNLCELGALRRIPPESPSRSLTTELTDAGQGLLGVADVVEHWLSRSPFGPITLPDTAARGTIRALVAGWNSAIIRVLAERPRSLAELSSEISGQSYPSLKRRLSKLRAANLVTPIDGCKRSPAHAATQWLRCAVGPLSVAGRWERHHAGEEAPPMTRPEIEAALMLAIPLVDLPRTAAGKCVLAAPAVTGAAGQPSLAAVSVVVEGGAVISCAVGAEETPTTWALGTPDAWLDAMADGNCDSLRLGGPDENLVAALVGGIHESVFETYVALGE